jgi:hypothetical protein
MVNLKCPSLYDGLREHDTIVDEAVVRGGGCKCFGIAPAVERDHLTTSVIKHFNFQRLLTSAQP